MSDVVKITTHQADALKRLLQQYKNKPKISGLINAFSEQIQSSEDSLFDMFTSRSIFDAVGKQLDKIGAILGLTRPNNLNDTDYRGLLLGKIGLNVSQGETERVISVYQIVTEATLVQMQELFPAGVMLMSDTEVMPNLVDVLYDFVQAVVGAGIRVDHYGFFDKTTPFSLEGPYGPGDGFGDATDVTPGGKMGALYAPARPIFAFASGVFDLRTDGFGTLVDDPIAGGKLL